MLPQWPPIPPTITPLITGGPYFGPLIKLALEKRALFLAPDNSELDLLDSCFIESDPSIMLVTFDVNLCRRFLSGPKLPHRMKLGG